MSDSKDGGNIFLRNFSFYLPKDTAWHYQNIVKLISWLGGACNATVWTVRGSNPGRSKRFFLLESISLTFKFIWYRGLEVAVAEVNPSPPATIEVKNERSYTSTPSTCVQSVDRENFTLTSISYVSLIRHMSWKMSATFSIHVLRSGSAAHGAHGHLERLP